LGLIDLIVLHYRDGTSRAWVYIGNSRQLPPLCRPSILIVLIVIYSDEIKDIIIFSLVRTIIVKGGAAARRRRPLSFGRKRALATSNNIVAVIYSSGIEKELGC
jgi:hypothetical protein